MKLYAFDSNGKCTIEEKPVKNMTLKQLEKLWKQVNPKGCIFKQDGRYQVAYTDGGKCYGYTASNLYRLAVKLKLMTEEQVKETRGY